MLNITPDRLPLVGEATLRAHRAFETYDTRFRACARLLQSLWRDRQGLPMGTYTSPGGQTPAGLRPDHCVPLRVQRSRHFQSEAN